MLDERQAVLVERQILREIRRSVLSVMAAASARYGIPLAAVGQGISTGNVPPEFRREWDELVRITGLPRAQVAELVSEVVMGGQREDKSADWDIADLNALVAPLAAHGSPSYDQLSDVAKLARRVVVTAARTKKAAPTVEALVRQAMGKSEVGQDGD